MTKKLLEGFAKDQLIGFWEVFIFKGMLSINGRLISEAIFRGFIHPKNQTKFLEGFLP